MCKYTSELRADELGTNETPNVMTVGVEKYGLNVFVDVSAGTLGIYWASIY
jgi:hypothetical protein